MEASENSGVMAADTGVKRSPDAGGSGAAVVYGKQPDAGAEGKPAESGQPEAGAEQKAGTEAGKDKKALWKELTEGEYRDEFQNQVQGIINKRFREMKGLQEQNAQLGKLAEKLADRYGVAAGDTEALLKAIDGDGAFYRDQADKAGMTVDQYRDVQNLRRENEAYRRQQEALERERGIQEQVAKWNQEAEAVKGIYPDFNLEAEFQNKDFADLVNGHVIDTQDKHKKYTFSTALIAAPVTWNGADYYMGVAIKQDQNKNNQYYVHDAVMVKKNEAVPVLSRAVPAQGATTGATAPSIARLLAELVDYNVKFGKNQRTDAAYLEAVRRGDMKTAERMVQEAAEQAFADSKIRDEDGKLLPVYHGTSEQFTVFDRTKGRANMDIQGMFFSPWEIDAGGYGENVGKYYLNIKNPASEAQGYSALNRYKGQNGAGVKAREDLIRKGYDGVDGEGMEYIAFESEQIKSADPVTYDDQGNVIPLSERFNTENDDIRYSQKIRVRKTDEIGRMTANAPDAALSILNTLYNTVRDGEHPIKKRLNAKKNDLAVKRQQENRAESRNTS